MCKNWKDKGNCKYGDKCLFAHGTAELTKRSTANGPEPPKPLAALVEKPVETENLATKHVFTETNCLKEIESAKTSFFTFETPAKDFEQKSEIMTPAFSTQEFMSTQMSTADRQIASWGKVTTHQEHNFSKLSALVSINDKNCDNSLLDRCN